MRLLATLLLALSAALLTGGTAFGQTQNYFGTTGTLSGSVWSTNPAGPYTDPLNTTGGAVINFGNAASFTGGSIVVAGINATANATGSSPTGTLSNLNNGVVTINTASGKTLDFGSQSFTSSATAGYIKTGDGVLALAGGDYGGGFTLNAGTVILRGVNALGSSVNNATNTLTLNGGVIASNTSLALTGKYGGGITAGGNVQFGDVTGLAASTANLTFSNNIALGNSARTLTLGNAGTQTFGGVISNGVAQGSDALTFAATAGGTGRFDITNIANTFTGNVRITGGEVRFSSNGSLGNANNSVMIDGGRFAFATGFSTLATTHKLFVGDTAGTAISTTSGTVTYNGVIANVTGKTGSWVKQGIGTLALGGVSTYSGSTTISEGILQLTAGNNRLPTGTVVNLGQAAGPVMGTFDLNGQSQTIAGLNSITGTNTNTADKNIVTNTSGTASTLTLGGNGNYSYGGGTAANSGVLTGSISVEKAGSGTQTFGDINTYVGITSVNGGTLLVTNAGGTGNGEVNVNNTGTLGGNGAIYGTLFVNAGGTLRSDSGTGTGTLTLASTTLFGGSGATGATLATQLAVNGSGAITANSQVAVSTNTFNVDLAGGKFNIKLLNDLGLTQNASYTITLVTGAGGSGNFLRNGSAATGGNAFLASDFNLISGSGAWTFSGVSLTVNGSNNLVLQFTPVPEPATVLAVGAAGLAVAGWVRRRRTAASG